MGNKGGNNEPTVPCYRLLVRFGSKENLTPDEIDQLLATLSGPPELIGQIVLSAAGEYVVEHGDDDQRGEVRKLGLC